MKKSKDVNMKDMLEDMEILMSYVDDVKQTKLEELNLEEIQKKQKEFEEKYKDFLPKDNLDSKE